MAEQSPTGSSNAGKSGDGGGSSVEEKADAVVKFTVEELKAKARTLFNCSQHAVAGALALEKRELWTVEEAGRKVEAFLKREVAPSDRHVAQGRTV